MVWAEWKWSYHPHIQSNSHNYFTFFSLSLANIIMIIYTLIITMGFHCFWIVHNLWRFRLHNFQIMEYSHLVEKCSKTTNTCVRSARIGAHGMWKATNGWCQGAINVNGSVSLADHHICIGIAFLEQKTHALKCIQYIHRKQQANNKISSLWHVNLCLLQKNLPISIPVCLQFLFVSKILKMKTHTHTHANT